MTEYDSFRAGELFGSAKLEPFSFTLDDFDATYTRGTHGGAPLRREGHRPDRPSPSRTQSIRSNHPLNVDGTKVFLVGHGYAPRFTVRDGNGDVVFRDSVAFLPQDGNFTSTGVVKVPDAHPAQLGFLARFLPDLRPSDRHGPISTFPRRTTPAVFCPRGRATSAWTPASRSRSTGSTPTT